MSDKVAIEDVMRKKLQKEAERKAFNEHALTLRHDTRKNGVKFWDVKGSGRIIKGKKVYD